MALEEKQTHKYDVAAIENDEMSSCEIFSKFREPVYRSQFLHWMWFPCALLSLGIVISQAGPTILDLQIITDTDEETSSLFFTSTSGGYLLGSFVAGALHRKINNNIIMAVITIGGGASTVATPYCISFVSMLVIRAVSGLFLGTIDCTVNAEHMRIWGTEGQALLQFTHFSFAIGGVIGPLFAAPFLAKKNTTATPDVNMTYDLISNSTNLTMPRTNMTYDLISNSTNLTLPRTTDVHYAYLIGGIILAITAVPFLIMLLFFNTSKTSETKQKDESNERTLPTILYVFMTAVLCAFYVAYCCIENTFSSFLETFLVNEFDISKERAAYITTFYWAAFAAGRFSGIFTSKCLIAVRLLYMHFCVMSCAFTGFLISALYGRTDILTVFTCLVGLSLSSVYPAGFSWTEAELMKVTGKISAVILVGSSFGSMVNPFIMGYLMKHESNFWFCYFLLGAVVVTCSLFVFLLVFNRCIVNKMYGTINMSITQVKKNPPTKKPLESAF